MNLKRGFTLIELLAVIIILAVVALIATPIILDVVEDAKKSAGSSEANMILSGINNYCETEELKIQMDSEYKSLCTSSMDKDDVKEMVNLGNAEILEIEYTDKLILLKVKSNGHIYILQGNQMVEQDTTEPSEPEEPSVPESVSFAEDSWETIAAIVKAGKADQYYSVGDEKEVTLDGYTNGSESTFTVRIANMSTPTECSTEGFSQTACGFVVEFVDVITTNVMNSDIMYEGGWPSSEMYAFLNTNIYNALQSDLKNIIIDTHSKSGYMGSDTVNHIFDSLDKMYLFSFSELVYEETDADIISNYTRTLDFYNDYDCKPNSCEKMKKEYQKSPIPWWTRSSLLGAPYMFYYVTNFLEFTNQDIPLGVAPAFRIG